MTFTRRRRSRVEPVSTGGGWRLCNDPDAFLQPRQSGLAYMPNRAIQLDRNALVFEPAPPVVGVLR